MLSLLHWYYVEFLISGDHVWWYSLIMLAAKTIVLLLVLMVVIKVITFILKPFIKGFKREWTKDKNINK